MSSGLTECPVHNPIGFYDWGPGGVPDETECACASVCPGCGGNEDPCSTCIAAWLTSQPEMLEDFLFCADFDRAGERWRICDRDGNWRIDGGPELARLGLLETMRPALTPLGLDVAHAIRAAQKGANS